MEDLVRQLETARRRTRLLLFMMHGASWSAAVLAAAWAAGYVDYALRLPAWLRVFWIVVAAFGFAYYIARSFRRALRVRPTLPLLALRLESLYPTAAGRLASAVAFASEPPPQSRITAWLAHRATQSAQGVLDESQVRKLIDIRPCLQAQARLLLAVGLLAVTALTAPQSFATAVERWANPFGDARWPNRYAVQSLTLRQVAANNSPIPTAAQVTRGDKPNLRTWVVYRFVQDDKPGEWRRELMTRQNQSGGRGGTYERLVEPQPNAQSVQLYFTAGDDATDAQTLQLIQPPQLVSLTAEVTPPSYAAAILPTDRHTLLLPPRPSVTTDLLEGSRLTLHMAVTGSLQLPTHPDDPTQLKDWLAAGLPGSMEAVDAQRFAELAPEFTAQSNGPQQWEVRLAVTLVQPWQFRFNLADAYGTRYEDARLFRFEVRPDRSPRAAVTQPGADQTVLPTALIPLAAEANDDVAVSRLELQARVPGQAPASLSVETPQAPQAQTQVEFDLAPLKLQPGQEVALVAVATDNFELAGRRHDPSESTPRLLKIIGIDELLRQVRTELADLRQRTLRAQSGQQQLLSAPADAQAAQSQRELTGKIEAMERSIAQLSQRVERNRLDDAPTQQMLAQAGDLLDEARQASEQATAGLSANQSDQARPAQQQTDEKLNELARMLDQGRDAYELKQKLIKLSRDQQAQAEAVRRALPSTLGQDFQNLSDELKNELVRSAAQQKELAQEARQLMERMSSTAAALSRQSEDASEQAIAEALRQASETGTRESLDRKMEQAAQQVGQNRLADAQQQQQEAQRVIEQMLEQIDRAEKLKQEILRRKLTELVDAIRALRDQQKAQLERLLAAQGFDDLDAALLTLHGNTVAVAEQARRTDPKAEPVAESLAEASRHQTDAIKELRNTEVQRDIVVVAEQSSLEALEEALKRAQALKDETEEDLTAEQRDKLIEKYKQALEAQKDVRTQTRAYSQTPTAQRDRRWRAELVKLGGRQKAIGQSLDELKAEVEQTLVYKSVHEQMTRWVAQAADDLSKATPTVSSLFQQDMTVAAIEAMIESLGPDQPDEEFAEDSGDNGGGGEGQGGEQPLVPPLAELKLLRARQEAIRTATAALAQVADPALKPRMTQELSRQQESLAETGEALMKQLQQQR